MSESERLVAQLSRLPAVDDPWFPPRLNDVIFRFPSVRPVLEEIVRDESVDLEVRFKAFYGYLNHARRSLDLTEYEQFHHRYLDLFESFPIAKVLRSQTYLNHIQAGQFDQQCARRAMHFAGEARDLLPNHFGVMAHWASTVAEIQSRLPESERNQKLLKDAIEVQERALFNSDEKYPRYFATKAMLLRLVGLWDQALTAVATAIDREDSSLADYPVRVGRYQALRSEIETERRIQSVFASSVDQLNALEAQAAAVRRELDDMRSSTLTLVGLLAAIVAFVTTTSSLAARLEFTDAVKLVSVTTASVVVVFASLLWLVGRTGPVRASLKYLIVVGTAIVQAALVLLLL